MEECSNCHETNDPCACMRNKCIRCGKPVGNITFTVCDDCWEREHPKPTYNNDTSTEYGAAFPWYDMED